MPAASGSDDVVRVRVAYVRDILGLHIEHVEREREDRGIGLRDADDRRVDDDHHRNTLALADLTDAEAAEHRLDLPGRVADDTDRDPGLVQCAQRDRRTRRSASATDARSA